MNTEALFLFLILLLGLLLCSFLGGNCYKEGFDISLSSAENSVSNMYDSTANAVDSAYDSTANAVDSAYNSTANTVDSAYNNVSNAVSSSFDNYNHYNGSGSSSQLQNGMIFTDTSGNTVTVVVNSNGTQSLQLLQTGQSTPMVLSSTPPSSSNITAAPNTFYAPFGQITAVVITGSNGQIAVQFNLPGSAQPIIFTQQSGQASNGITSTQYYGSTGYPIQQGSAALSYQQPYGSSAGAVTGPYGNSAYYAQGPNGNTVAGTSNSGYGNQYYGNQYQGPYGGSAGAVTGPYGNSIYYAQGPNGNTVAGTSNSGYGNQYYSTMPQGIPASQIPSGQEDLYILKSEIVPPVCPACPAAASCPRQEPCPPCPACARCPEPSFECKKVPNYNAINSDYLPRPVLNDFSQFGM
jgi:hypothetical protein